MTHHAPAALHLGAPPKEPLWVRRPQLFATVATTLMLVAFAIEALRLSALPFASSAGPALGALLTAVGLVSSRVLPWPGLAVGWAGLLITCGAGWDPIVEYSALAFALFALVARGMPPLRPGVVSAVVLSSGFLLLAAVAPGRGSESIAAAWLSTDALAGLTAIVAAVCAAAALVAQANVWRALAQRAEDAIASRELLVEQRVLEERVRVARDLHDIIGHQVAVVSVHLGAVEMTAGKDDGATIRSLNAAREAVRSILADTQRTVSVLRGANGEAPAGPAPNLDGLRALIASFEEIGLQVHARIDEELGVVDPAEALTAYRVLQEALTNAHRYGTGTASVRVERLGDELRVAVQNMVRPNSARASGGGYGLVGIKERVAAAGGGLDVSESEGVFRVTARLDAQGGRVR